MKSHYTIRGTNRPQYHFFAHPFVLKIICFAIICFAKIICLHLFYETGKAKTDFILLLKFHYAYFGPLSN